MSNHWVDWEDQMRKENKIWNNGFRWGAFSGLGFMVFVIAIINWIVP